MSDKHHEAGESAREIERYWTPERRHGAKPRELTVKPRIRGARTRETFDEPGVVEGHPPEGWKSERALSPEIRTDPYRVPPDRINFPPYSCIGQIFFTSAGNPFTGSAAVVGRNLLITAAHNLYDAGEWSKHVLFVPACRDDQGPFGSWAFNREWVKDAWYDERLHDHDIGLVRLDPGGVNNRAIGDVVGTLGYMFGGDPRQRSWLDVGYPGNFDDARQMYAQGGEYTRLLDDGGVVGMSGWLGSGTSGGPWMMWDQRYWPRIYGLHSFRMPNDYADEVFSPYFGDWVNQFIQNHV